MPRVLHVINDLRYGGSQTQLRLLAASAAQPSGLASRQLLTAERDSFVAGIESVTWLKSRFRIDPFAVWNLRCLVRRERAEVLHSWDVPSASLCRALRRLVSIRWIHTLHDGAVAASRGADAVLVRDASRKEAAECRLRIDRVAIVPSAFDPSIDSGQQRDQAAARERLRQAGVDVSNDCPVVVAVVRMDQPAAVRELAWAADLVRIVCPGLRMLIAGDGPARVACERFSAAATEPGLNVFLGPWRDLATLYEAADVAWCGAGPSPTPTPALEAMASGLPLVLADGPGRDALLADESDEPQCRLRWDDRAAWARVTKRLLTDKQFATRIGQRNADHVHGRYSLTAVAQAYQAVLAQACRG